MTDAQIREELGSVVASALLEFRKTVRGAHVVRTIMRAGGTVEVALREGGSVSIVVSEVRY